MPVALELDELEDCLSTARRCSTPARARRQEERLGEHAGPQARMPPDEQVLDHGQVREELAVLEGARDAERRDPSAAARR